MEDGNVNEFLEKITYQEEALLFKGEKYFFNGWGPIGHAKLDVELLDQDDLWVRNVFHIEGRTMQECVDEMTKAPIWDGKTFWEAESEMTWTEW